MAHYRKKPLVVEAYRFLDEARPPEWLRNALNDGRVFYGNPFLGHLIVKTTEGDLRVQLGDWIIKDKDEITPCKDDVFQANYEPVEQAEADA